MKSFKNLLYVLSLSAMLAKAKSMSECSCIKLINNSTQYYDIYSSYCTDEENTKPLTRNQVPLYGHYPEDENEYDDVKYPELNLCSEEMPPKCFYSLKNVDELVISGNMTKFENFGSMKNLKYLQVYKTATTKIPNFIGKLRNLESINFLFNPKMKGKLLDSIVTLPKLKKFEINNNQKVSGSISVLKNIKNTDGFKNIKIVSTKISGSIPKEISKFEMLNEIIITESKISGPIPESVFDLKRLYKIALSNNQITGKIPQAIGKSINLNYIYLDNNKLTGPIPESIGNLNKLSGLFLNNNQLNGVLPESLNNMESLSSVDFSNNPDLYGYVLESEDIYSCNYENTNICYKTGNETCITGASKCTEEQIKIIDSL